MLCFDGSVCPVAWSTLDYSHALFCPPQHQCKCGVCSLGVAPAGMDGRLTHACRSCGVLVCRTCCVDDHLTKGHSAVPVDTAATEAAKAIAAAMPSLRTCTCATVLGLASGPCACGTRALRLFSQDHMVSLGTR